MVSININSKYTDMAEKQQYKKMVIDDSRGIITDINFNNITNTITNYKTLVTAYDTDLQDVFNALTDNEKSVFDDNIKYYKNFIAEVKYPIKNRYLYPTTQRYSDFNIAQHLVGYIDSTGNGVSGMEKIFNDQLKEANKVRTLRANVNGYGEIISKEEQIEGKQSNLLALTVDNTIQRMCEGIAKEYIPNGSIIVMECKTGKIKAMVSTPFYNANNVSLALKQDYSPLLNKALQSYEAGSVIKPLWASVYLENGYNKDKKYECTGTIEVNGHEYHCANNTAHGEINMEEALKVSCNCYFINAEIENKEFYFRQMAKNINFGDALYLTRDYKTTSGYFPTLEELDNIGQLSSISFGQGRMLLSPIHVAAYMNIFANNGIYVYPQVAQGIYNADNKELITNLYEYNQKQIISEKTAETVKNMLRTVVEEGAMGRACPEHLSAGGKTGTAQTGRYNDNGTEILNAWFCGFYPFDNPKYTICIMMHNGGESTYTAAPIFKKICDSLYYII